MKSFALVYILAVLALTATAQRNVPDATALYKSAIAMQQRTAFDSATTMLKQLLSLPAVKADPVKNKDVTKRLAECKSGSALKKTPRIFIVTHLGNGVNSSYADYAPVVSADEQGLFFTSRRPVGDVPAKTTEGTFYEDVYYAEQSNGQWSSARNIGPPINNAFHNSNLALSADGRQLFLYTDENEGDILMSEKKDGVWSVPQRLPYPVNTSYHESSVSISPDGSKLFVASERPGGLGGSDIYLVEKNYAGEWSRIINLGPGVNTPWHEDSPFIDYDNKTLYFSSQGHTSMGGFDIFKVTLNQGKPSGVENLGFPINTPGNDIHFISTRDGKRAYYSSVRPEGFGEEDIYMITLPPELTREDVIIRPAPTSASSAKENEALNSAIVYFDFGSDALKQSGSLDSNINVWLKSTDVILVEGHTDVVGSEKFNEGLSLRRAKTVQAYLVSKGIRVERIRVTGFGRSRPVAPNQEEKNGREQNRRVEIRLMKD
ncbi:MAG: OmpA family protein [Cyclobacteriaceae bacterium]|nr:OmpA family protein [Cyclobacteriaceae bacterium]